MTVKELIAELSKYPEDIEVEVECGYDGGKVNFVELKDKVYPYHHRTYINIVGESL